MHPRWLVALGCLGILASQGCYPPVALTRLASVTVPTGNTPGPRTSAEDGEEGGIVTPAPVAPSFAAAERYFPIRAGTWRYRTRAARNAAGTAVAGERTLVVSEVKVEGATTTAQTITTTTLNVPGFSGLDQQALRGSLWRNAAAFKQLDAAGAEIATVPLPLGLGQTFVSGGLAASIVASDTLQATGLGGKLVSQVARLEYRQRPTDKDPVATAWLAPDLGLVQQTQRFEHEGATWEVAFELVAVPE